MLLREPAHPSPTVIPSLVDQYRQVRQLTHKLCEPLVTEDYVIQTMPDVSPTKWHLAHTSWFFETFILGTSYPGYQPFHPMYNYLFNSYYNAVGVRHCRPKRGQIARPSVAEVYRYREYVDEHMLDLLEGAKSGQLSETLHPLVELGLHHEMQHQELVVTDLKHVFACNPLHPVYRDRFPVAAGSVPPLEWIGFTEGIYPIGFDGGGFAFDNESPRHRVFLEAFELGSRPVTNGEYLAFVSAGGYERPELWLSEGWATVQANGWVAPLYWDQQDGAWWQMTLSGFRPVDESEPVCHVSYFEADAYARWAGVRLPSEQEWEAASVRQPIAGNFVEVGHYHPVPVKTLDSGEPLAQLFGDVWEWTLSSYAPYPGYRPAAGALGEYNGKFMCNQYVLRGGSAATPLAQMRHTYRNFFPADARWQFTGIRLAREIR